MKFVFYFFIFVFTSFSSYAQYEETIVNPNYPFKGARISSFPENTAYGIFLFRTDIEYFSFQSAGKFNPILDAPFFSYDEMGVIIHKQMPSGCDYCKIESVIETYDKIIINLVTVRPSFRTADMADYMLCLRLKKSRKEVYVSESVQEVQSQQVNYVRCY